MLELTGGLVTVLLVFLVIIWLFLVVTCVTVGLLDCWLRRVAVCSVCVVTCVTVWLVFVVTCVSFGLVFVKVSVCVCLLGVCCDV